MHHIQRMVSYAKQSPDRNEFTPRQKRRMNKKLKRAQRSQK